MTPTQRYRHWNEAERAAFLDGVSLFAQLPRVTLRHLAARFRPQRAQRGALLFHEGTPADTLHLLAAGQIHLIRETADGQKAILWLIHPGEIFGGNGGWGEAVYPTSALVREDAVVLSLPTPEVTALLDRHPAFAAALVRAFAGQLREAEARILELQTERMHRRVALVLLRLAQKVGVPAAPGIALRGALSRQDLAELAGTTVSNASRTVRAWDRRGIIAAGRERITILDPPALEAIAEDDTAHDQTDGT